jgi:hypothetical protein
MLGTIAVLRVAWFSFNARRPSVVRQFLRGAARRFCYNFSAFVLV